MADSVMPGRNGGTLKRGNPGGKGGIGQPPSLIRERLRGSFYERVGIIEEIADGTPMVRTRVLLAPLLPLLVCPNCGEIGVGLKEPENALIQEVDVLVSASPKDRLAALDLQAKYGLGQLKEVSVENVRERVAATLAIVRGHVSPEVMEAMMPELRKAWV